uniref:DUF2828 domain-containing protein n=1 Tax=Zea mays TaxID=4577 RepID=A0A804P993_MAIZE
MYSKSIMTPPTGSCMADLFVGLIAEDMHKLAAGKVREFSLASKWCPSLDSSYDHSTLIYEAHYVYRARERLRRVALVPLRRALKLPEVFISAHAWESVRYTRVASVAMKNYTDLFLKHDADRFNTYLADVKSGKKRIATGALLPHEIIASLENDSGGEVVDLQW